MLMANLPNDLQSEFERVAKSLYGGDSTTIALIEAIEFWLASRRSQEADAERVTNIRAYDDLKPELQRNDPSKWFVIAQGKLQTVTDSFEEANRAAPMANHRIIMQVSEIPIEETGRVTEFGWQTTFG